MTHYMNYSTADQAQLAPLYQLMHTFHVHTEAWTVPGLVFFYGAPVVRFSS